MSIVPWHGGYEQPEREPPGPDDLAEARVNELLASPEWRRVIRPGLRLTYTGHVAPLLRVIRETARAMAAEQREREMLTEQTARRIAGEAAPVQVLPPGTTFGPACG